MTINNPLIEKDITFLKLFIKKRPDVYKNQTNPNVTRAIFKEAILQNREDQNIKDAPQIFEPTEMIAKSDDIFRKVQSMMLMEGQRYLRKELSIMLYETFGILDVREISDVNAWIYLSHFVTQPHLVRSLQKDSDLADRFCLNKRPLRNGLTPICYLTAKFTVEALEDWHHCENIDEQTLRDNLQLTTGIEYMNDLIEHFALKTRFIRSVVIRLYIEDYYKNGNKMVTTKNYRPFYSELARISSATCLFRHGYDELYEEIKNILSYSAPDRFGNSTK